MTRKNNRTILAVGLAGALLALTACDDGLSRLGLYSWVEDPPKVMLVAGGKLVAVRFDQFGMGFRVGPVTTVQVPGPSLSPITRLDFNQRNSGSRQGGGFDPLVDPDPDEHFMCPDLWPLPDDDFPVPDPPLPMPDYPDEDPFDGLPEPPPFEPGDLTMTNLSDGSLSIFDTGGTDGLKTKDPVRAANGQVRTATVAKIRIGAQPVSFKMSPDRKRLYASYASGIAVIDRAALAVVDQITLPPEARPHSLTISPDGKRLYVTSYLSTAAQVYTVDVATKTLVGTIPVGGFPSGIAMTPDGSQIWVTSFFSGNITVIDALTNTRILVISNISAAWGIHFNPTGTRAFVTSAESVGGNLKVIDTATYTVKTTVPTGDGPRGIGVTPTGRHVFVANYGADTITQIDATTNAVVRTITVGAKPQGFQFLR